MIIFSYSTKKDPKPITVVYKYTPVLQSPEYRCSTKCFDCVKQRSSEHLNKSHGQPQMFGLH